MHVALMIAVETYADPALTPRRYAAADGRAISEALAAAGYAALDQVVLVDAQATSMRRRRRRRWNRSSAARFAR
jgi:hypothetical protein